MTAIDQMTTQHRARWVKDTDSGMGNYARCSCGWRGTTRLGPVSGHDAREDAERHVAEVAGLRYRSAAPSQRVPVDGGAFVWPPIVRREP